MADIFIIIIHLYIIIFSSIVTNIQISCHCNSHWYISSDHCDCCWILIYPIIIMLIYYYLWCWYILIVHISGVNIPVWGNISGAIPISHEAWSHNCLYWSLLPHRNIEKRHTNYNIETLNRAHTLQHRNIEEGTHSPT